MLANEIACRHVANDFHVEASQRLSNHAPGARYMATGKLDSPRHSHNIIAARHSQQRQQCIHVILVRVGMMTLWGLGVGYVISGEYFGWNLGLPAGGSAGLLIAFLLVTTMYVTFV